MLQCEQQCKQPIKKLFTVTDGNQVLSRSAVVIDYKLEGRPSATIEDVWTDPAFRRRGLGRSMVEQCIQFAREQNCYKIVLICDESNVSFYDKSGFHCHQLGMRLNLYNETEAK